ncbi:MAG: serine/threonine protein kinase, partial [Alphaproteobacteria bacterium]|nr:serine/threonine protein kinase [Alphaproteobacteria bacterium]
MNNNVEKTGSDAEGSFGDELATGTPLLRGQYTIDRFLNSGGFGITYLASDSLDRTVVIKECFPSSMCCRTNNTVRVRSRTHKKEFEAIVNLFGQEARALAKLQHPNIVGVHQVFEDNETSYMALDFVRGRDLLDVIEEEPHLLGADQIKSILMKMLSAVGYIHDRGILHRDISPDNILLDEWGNPVLIDFGAAREEATRVSRVLS